MKVLSNKKVKEINKAITVLYLIAATSVESKEEIEKLTEIASDASDNLGTFDSFMGDVTSYLVAKFKEDKKDGEESSN